MKECIGAGREWEWALVEEALEETRIWPMREYVRRRQATIEEYVAYQPIYNLFIGVDHIEGSRRFLRWWDQYNGPNQAEQEVGWKRGSV